ncbi:hypothetical protein D3C72_2170720 [compost metagenome]
MTLQPLAARKLPFGAQLATVDAEQAVASGSMKGRRLRLVAAIDDRDAHCPTIGRKEDSLRCLAGGDGVDNAWWLGAQIDEADGVDVALAGAEICDHSPCPVG